MRTPLLVSLSPSLLVALSLACGETKAADPTPAAWSTYRANAQRTGNSDGAAGPATAKVLWVHKSMEHFIASPVAFGDRVYLAGLGGFNVPTFHCMSADPKAAQRELWFKSSPYLKLPTVSSPVLAGDKLIFGDGMHQTSGAFLHCLGQDKGMPLWQLPVPGELVHLEGTPTVAGDKVYIGGGAAGVICVRLDKVHQVMRDAPLLFRRGFGRANRKGAVDLRRIACHHFPVEPLGEKHTQRRFARSRRPDDRDQRRQYRRGLLRRIHPRYLQ